MIPEGWTNTKLGKVADIRRGASPRPIKDSRWFSESGYGWVRISDVTSSSKYLVKTTQYLSDEGKAKSVTVVPGDLVMSICGTIGKPIILSINACIHDGFVLFAKIKQNTNTEFLYYFLEWESDKFSSQGQPGTQKNLNTSLIKDTSVLLPPLLEQKKIAAILSSVDEAIQATQKVIDQTELVKKGLLQELLTKGIGHTEFKKTKIGEIPVGWEVKKLKDLAASQKGTFTNGPFGSDLLKSDLKDRGIPVVYIKDIKDGFYNSNNQVFIDEQKADALLAAEVKPNDILFSKVGDPPCKPCIFPMDLDRAIITQDVIRLRADTKKVTPAFIKAYFESEMGIVWVGKIAIEGTRKRVALGQFKELSIPLPPLLEQKKITEILSSVDESIQKEKEKKEQLELVKKGLMQDLLTGKVRVKV